LFYAGNVAKKVTGKGKTKNPHETPRSVICNKLAVMHLADTGNKWGKGSNNWDKSGQKDGFAPMFSVKLLGFVYMFLIDGNFWVVYKFLAKEMTYPVVYRVA